MTKVVEVQEYVSGGATRCVQASYRMTISAFLGYDPGLAGADLETGYVEGRGTWQFKAMLSFAEKELSVKWHENFDETAFLEHPKNAILNAFDSRSIADSIIAETNLELERDRLARCIKAENINFVKSVPTLEDIIYEVKSGKLVLVSINHSILKNAPGRQGHMLIVSKITPDAVFVHDPSIHGSLNRRIELKMFEEAWLSPSADLANYISVGL